MMAQRSNPQDEKRRSPLDDILVILITVILSVVLVALLSQRLRFWGLWFRQSQVGSRPFVPAMNGIIAAWI
jgi:hypothetical protein